MDAKLANASHQCRTLALRLEDLRSAGKRGTEEYAQVLYELRETTKRRLTEMLLPKGR